jgi:hypothetical protein
MFRILVGNGISEESNPLSLSHVGRLAVKSLANLSAALESTVYVYGRRGQGDRNLCKLLCSRVDVCLSLLLQRSPSARAYLFSEMQGGDGMVQNGVLSRSRSAEVRNSIVFLGSRSVSLKIQLHHTRSVFISHCLLSKSIEIYVISLLCLPFLLSVQPLTHPMYHTPTARYEFQDLRC